MHQHRSTPNAIQSAFSTHYSLLRLHPPNTSVPLTQKHDKAKDLPLRWFDHRRLFLTRWMGCFSHPPFLSHGIPSTLNQPTNPVLSFFFCRFERFKVKFLLFCKWGWLLFRLMWCWEVTAGTTRGGRWRCWRGFSRRHRAVTVEPKQRRLLWRFSLGPTTLAFLIDVLLFSMCLYMNTSGNFTPLFPSSR